MNCRLFQLRDGREKTSGIEDVVALIILRDVCLEIKGTSDVESPVLCGDRTGTEIERATRLLDELVDLGIAIVKGA